jgi:hypothetical protein
LSKFWPKHSSKFWLKHYGQKLILKYISLKFKVKWQMIGKLSSLGFNFQYCARCLTQLSVPKKHHFMLGIIRSSNLLFLRK